MAIVTYKNHRLISAPFPDCCKKERTIIMKDDKEIFFSEELIVTGICYVGGTMFKVGDRVSKVGGDYTHDGEVRAVFTKMSGETRYVVENDFNHSLYIFSDKNLELRPLEYQKIIDDCYLTNVMIYDCDFMNKNVVSYKLEELLKEQGRRIYCTEFKYLFKLDYDHNKYVLEKFGTSPHNSTKFVLAVYENGKYLIGAY